ncbi:MAG: hypothetical protein J0H69_00580 [Burkholderiales bacterium]|nr:hypothetical protein [Burkholderiales bacterium]
MRRYQLRHHTPHLVGGAVPIDRGALALVAAEQNFVAMLTWINLVSLASESRYGPFTAADIHAALPADMATPPPVEAINAALTVLHRLDLVLIVPN